MAAATSRGAAASAGSPSGATPNGRPPVTPSRAPTKKIAPSGRSSLLSLSSRCALGGEEGPKTKRRPGEAGRLDVLCFYPRTLTRRPDLGRNRRRLRAGRSRLVGGAYAPADLGW